MAGAEQSSGAAAEAAAAASPGVPAGGGEAERVSAALGAAAGPAAEIGGPVRPLAEAGPDTAGAAPEAEAGAGAGAVPASGEAAEAGAGAEAQGGAGTEAGAAGSEVGAGAEAGAGARTGVRVRIRGRGVVAAAAAEGEGGAEGRAPFGRPPKSLLAGSAIAGAILVTVPLLLMAMSDEEKEEAGSANAQLSTGSMTLEDEQVAGGGSGPYTMESPTPQPAPQPSTGTGTGTGTAADTGADSGLQPGPDGTDGQGGDPEPQGADPEASAGPQAQGTGSRDQPGAIFVTPQGTTETARKGQSTPNAPAAVVVADPSNSKQVLLRNKMTGKCADLPGTGPGKGRQAVVLGVCNNKSTDNQLWNLEVRYAKGGPGGTNLFTIRNAKDGLCLDLEGTGGKPKYTRVLENSCIGTKQDNQLWWLQSRGNGDYWIHNYASDQQCLNVVGWAGEGGVGSPLEIRPCLVNDDHKWLIGK